MDHHALLRKKILSGQRKALTNTRFSIISSNCNGGVITHDLGLQHNSPFVNLWVKPGDFLWMVENLREAMQMPLAFTSEAGIDYPVGVIGGMRLYFQHYASEAEALEKWNERRARILYDRLFIMMTDRDGCTHEDLVRFDALPHPKVVFTSRAHPDIRSAFRLKRFAGQAHVGICTDFVGRLSGHRYLDEYDYVAALNAL